MSARDLCVWCDEGLTPAGFVCRACGGSGVAAATCNCGKSPKQADPYAHRVTCPVYVAKYGAEDKARAARGGK